MCGWICILCMALWKSRQQKYTWDLYLLFWFFVLIHFKFICISLVISLECNCQHITLISVQFSSVIQSCPTLWDPMNCSTPGFPVHHQLPEFTQIHVHWVGDAIQSSHPLSSPFPPAFNLSQHQSFQMSQFSASGGQSVEFQLQHQSFRWIFRTDL